MYVSVLSRSSSWSSCFLAALSSSRARQNLNESFCFVHYFIPRENVSNLGFRPQLVLVVPKSTTSTSIKEITNLMPSSAIPLKSMVTSLGRSPTEQDSLELSGTSQLPSLPSSWPPRNTSPAWSPVTQHTDNANDTDYDNASAYE